MDDEGGSGNFILSAWLNYVGEATSLGKGEF